MREREMWVHEWSKKRKKREKKKCRKKKVGNEKMGKVCVGRLKIMEGKYSNVFITSL